MTEPSLRELEREVEAARAKLANDLSILRSPDTFSDFTQSLKHEVLDVKDELLAKAKTTARSTGEQIVEDLKGRAAANPAAVLAIGAGLAWRLMHRPPIAATLVGAGLLSLFRTNPVRGDHVDHLSYAKDRLKEQALDLAENAKLQAMNAAGKIQEQATDLAETARNRVEHWTGEAKDAVQRAAFDAKGRAAAVMDRTSSVIGDTLSSRGSSGVPISTTSSVRQSNGALQDARNNLLLGAAGLAVTLAAGIALQRRLTDEPDRDEETRRSAPLKAGYEYPA